MADADVVERSDDAGPRRQGRGMKALPHALVHVDARCPQCVELYGIDGEVSAVVDEQGNELWRVCRCGANVPMGATIQADLFPEASA